MMRNPCNPDLESSWILVSAIVALLFAPLACGDRPPAAGLEEAADSGVTPVPFPRGFNVPTDRTTIEDWVFASPQNTQAMFGHAWDIWNGMFQPSGEHQQQPDGRRELVVFKTWASDVDVFDSAATNADELAAAMPARNLKPFHVPRQLIHASFAQDAPPDTDPEQVLAFVKYDPVAASHIVTQGYNRASTLNRIQGSWPAGTPALDRQIDDFEPPSIALKPVWYLVKATGLTVFPVWPGPPSPAKAFGPGDWDTCVLVDPTNQGGGGTAGEPPGRGQPLCRVYGLQHGGPGAAHHRRNEPVRIGQRSRMSFLLQPLPRGGLRPERGRPGPVRRPDQLHELPRRCALAQLGPGAELRRGRVRGPRRRRVLDGDQA